MRGQRALAIALATPLLALLPAQDAPATPTTDTIQVDDASGDAPLSPVGKTTATCESTDATSGCTLRAAVELADQLSLESHQQIAVSLPAGTYTNTPAGGGQLTIAADADVLIVGAGARRTTIDGGESGSVIRVEELAALTLEGVSVRHGAKEFGGGILAEPEAAVQLVDTTIAENEALFGGGVYIAPEYLAPGIRLTTKQPAQKAVRPDLQPPTGPGLTIVGSTIVHNSAEGVGGGVYVEDEAFNEIANSTIAENKAGQVGGGVALTFAEVALSMDTMVDNSAEEEPAGANIVQAEPAEIFFHQTLIAEPTASGAPGCESIGQAVEPPVSFEYNLDYPSTPPGAGKVDGCGLSAESHDLVGANPLLEPSGLTDNGGETDTIAPIGGYSATPSPAADTVPLADCGVDVQDGFELVREDQRGSPRPDPNGSTSETDCDIGAYEFAATILTPSCSTPAPVNTGERVTVVCTIEKSEGLFATGTIASFSLPAGATLDSATPSQGGCAATECQLGTIDPATVTIVLTPNTSGTLSFTASDKERGGKATSVPVTVKAPAPLPAPAAPKPHQCKSRRDFKIHIQNVKRLKVVSAVVYVNKRRERAVKGKALHAAIDLHGLPKGTFKVKIVARTASGRRLVGVRIYHTCVARRPPHKHLFL